jgi:hypothetical protein
MQRSCLFLAAAAALTLSSSTHAQTWNSPGLPDNLDLKKWDSEAGPAPRRDLTGVWDAGRPGVTAAGYQTAPLTPWGDQVGKTHKSGDGARTAPLPEVNDPYNIYGDPAGFPRNVLYNLRPFQIVQTANQVLMLYMFEKRWRVIWTDGRELPKAPDPRWYGYSVGKWEDDYTFVVQTIGMDERTWLDNAGDPHSSDLRVEERYHRLNGNTLEITVTIDDPKAYTKPWVARNKLPLRLMPPETDLMEMILSATEAAEYKKIVADPTK